MTRPKPAAGLARAHGRVEGKHRRNGVGVAHGRCPGSAGRWKSATARPAWSPASGAQGVHRHAAAAVLERHLNRLQHPGALDWSQAETVRHHVQHLGAARWAVATSRWACTLVKPLTESHCSISSAVALAGNSTGKVSASRPQSRLHRTAAPAAARKSSRASHAAPAAPCPGQTAARHGQTTASGGRSAPSWCPRWSGWSAPGWSGQSQWPGGTPSTLSTAGLSMRSRNWRA